MARLKYYTVPLGEVKHRDPRPGAKGPLYVTILRAVFYDPSDEKYHMVDGRRRRKHAPPQWRGLRAIREAGRGPKADKTAA